jgi:hypothetical protein
MFLVFDPDPDWSVKRSPATGARPGSNVFQVIIAGVDGVRDA